MTAEAATDSGPRLVVDTAADFLQLTAAQRYAVVSANFPAWLLAEPIVFPRNHPTYGWACPVVGCHGIPGMTNVNLLCVEHGRQFTRVRDSTALDDFISAAEPLEARTMGRALVRLADCNICGSNREAARLGYCQPHRDSLARALEGGVSESRWREKQRPYAPYPSACVVPMCVHDGTLSRFSGAAKRVLCRNHNASWKRWLRSSGAQSSPLAFEEWLRSSVVLQSVSNPDSRGEVHLAGLPASLQREIRYALYRHAKTPRRNQLRPVDVQKVVNELLKAAAQSLNDPVVAELVDQRRTNDWGERRVWRDLPAAARSLTLTSETAKSAGWFDPLLSGGKPFPGTQSAKNRRAVWDLTEISQRWLRDLLWDYLHDQVLEPEGKRISSGTVYNRIRGTVLLSFLLEQVRSDRGHDPMQLTASDARAIKELIDLWHREKIPVPALMTHTGKEADGVLNERGRHVLMSNAHAVLRHSSRRDRTLAMESFILGLPDYPRAERSPLPRPLSFADFQVLVNADNLFALDELDYANVGFTDIWLTQAFQGGRISEVLTLRLGCIGMIGAGQPYLWRDISKVSVLDYGMPCHRPVYERLLRRQATTKTKLRARYRDRLAALDGPGRERLEAEWDRSMPLFPSAVSNLDLTVEVSYTAFRNTWTRWFAALGLSGITTHQTRATLATSLLNNGAPAELVRQMLGHFSNESLAHYARYNNESMTKHLGLVWAAGPGTDKPGAILLRPDDVTTTTGGSVRARIELAAVPVEHGLCRYGPVVGGSSCPFSKNCTNGREGPCEHFTLTGADLAYWERKRDAAFHFAEGAPNDEARDYILEAWNPWEPVLAGLRSALDELGLLEEAEKLDLRSPVHDYFHPVFSSAWTIDQLNPPTEDIDDDREASA